MLSWHKQIKPRMMATEKKKTKKRENRKENSAPVPAGGRGLGRNHLSLGYVSLGFYVCPTFRRVPPKVNCHWEWEQTSTLFLYSWCWLENQEVGGKNANLQDDMVAVGGREGRIYNLAGGSSVIIQFEAPLDPDSLLLITDNTVPGHFFPRYITP